MPCIGIGGDGGAATGAVLSHRANDGALRDSDCLPTVRSVLAAAFCNEAMLWLPTSRTFYCCSVIGEVRLVEARAWRKHWRFPFELRSCIFRHNILRTRTTFSSHGVHYIATEGRPEYLEVMIEILTWTMQVASPNVRPPEPTSSIHPLCSIRSPPAPPVPEFALFKCQ